MGLAVGVRVPSTTSMAVAVPSDTVDVGPVASCVMLAGGVTTGGVVSLDAVKSKLTETSAAAE